MSDLEDLSEETLHLLLKLVDDGPGGGPIRETELPPFEIYVPLVERGLAEVVIAKDRTLLRATFSGRRAVRDTMDRARRRS